MYDRRLKPYPTLSYAERKLRSGRGPVRKPLTQKERMAVHLARMVRYHKLGVRPISQQKLSEYKDYIEDYYPYSDNPYGGVADLDRMYVNWSVKKKKHKR